MPEYPNPKLVPHPASPRASDVRRSARASAVPYAELEVTSNFSFLVGASHPEELVRRAAELGHRAVAITDRSTLAGVVRAHVAAREAGIPLAIGCRLELELERRASGELELELERRASGGRELERRASDARGLAALEVLVYPTDVASYGRLCRLLTIGKRRTVKGSCELALRDLLAHERGLLAVVVPPAPERSGDPLAGGFAERVAELAAVFGERLSLAARALHGPDDRRWLARLAELARRTGVPLAATNDVHYHARGRRALQDVLTCVRHGCTVEQAGFRLFGHAERRLKPPEEMARLFAGHPAAPARAVEVAETAAAFGLEQLRYRYPSEIYRADRTPLEHLVELVREGGAARFPGGVPAKVRAQLEHELGLIAELDYAPYFLTVHDLVRFARSRGILCQGRGAAANSAVCYCLGITAVDPSRIDLLFERFVSKERDEPPDIDIDFEHERREEVIQYVYAKYGRDRAALTAEVITYRGRSAIRDVGKALGISLDGVDRLAKDVDWWRADVGEPERLRELGLDPRAPTTRLLLELANEVLGFPRHLSQHVGGFVITEDPLCERVPIENAAMPDRTVIEWDKDDLEAVGMLKVDVLGLGMLTAIRKSFELLNARGLRVERPAAGPEPLELYNVPPEDPAVYDMICAADTVGVFQIESRAQMSMLPRLRPREFYDLVIEVAIVRPGPIHGNMVHPYLRRRSGEERFTYPSEAVRRVLEKTLGVPLFQEQAMALAMVAAGFTAGEADELRRAMAAWKRKGDRVEAFRGKLVRGLLAGGYAREFADRFFEQIKGFSEYGFPESHAASFALLVYVSAWLKRYHPAAFAAALINSQPMGFYAPAQLVRDARSHGVEVLPIDVGASGWDCRLEGAAPALRLGMRLVKGLGRDDAEAVADAVGRAGPFATVEELQRVSGARARALRRLAQADAFASMGLDRRAALWQVRALRDERSDSLPFEPEGLARGAARLPSGTPLDRVLRDYASHGLSLAAHPVAFLREHLDALGVLPAAALADEARAPHHAPAATAGFVLVRQRPGTAKGIVFMTLEDETGIGNLIVHSDVFERYRPAARHAVLLLARGRVERQGIVVRLVVSEIESLDELFNGIEVRARNFH